VIDDFFRDIDERWKPTASGKIRLRIIGSTALMLQSDYDRGTKDSDVLRTAHITDAIEEQLKALAGKGTDLQRRHRMYVDIVSAALPFLPQQPRCHPHPSLTASLANFEIEVLDVVDVVVSKLKRFKPADQSDIEAMIDRGLVPHDALIERFKDAVDAFEMDARADELPQYVRNLHSVERNIFDLSETPIELPAWVSD
jgi:hypothetical protein